MVKLLLSCLVLLCVTGCTEERPLVGELRVCFAQDDLPRADRQSATGFDIDVARLVARELSKTFVPVWLPPPERTEIEVSDVSYTLLIKGQCDLQLSVPGEDAIAGIDAIALTAPYYGAAFELIPEQGYHDLANWQGAEIAVRANTVAHIVVDRYGLPWTMKRNTDEIIVAVTSGEAEAGLVWGPDLAPSRTKPNTLFEAPSALRWNQHMAARTSDGVLIEGINALMSNKEIADEIQDLLARHHIPAHAPFAVIHHSSDLEKLD